ncbi:DEAD/DEAH box helicase [Magnetospirillum moscoviense]|uniref:DEAD/DEAH box helicase n=1 Tax=Magnetospirillum moscoviense TaxID=1437059 RepID=A0A178MKY6_9PROT|nr:DEAD/DEAH box helicase [Magnetospirillum moscoviense]OAN49336.1 DEAD/DEAH box helicase [Magnetospirillum moscoviense]
MDVFTPDHPLSLALAERAYTELTDVQGAVLDPVAEGRDLLVSAQTGSGKTVAYGLALADTLLDGMPTLGAAGDPLALVVAPTRELALQVSRELTWLYAKAGARVVACVGGMDPRAEQRLLAQGVHIVVGTPGRLRDHLERGALRIRHLQAVVLDEADEMLDMGFREDLEFILEATPAERRTLLFSATLPKDIVAMAKRYQRNAWRIAIAAGKQGHADIEYRAVRVAPNETEHAVVNILRYIESPTAMVFCNTRESVRHLQAILLERGFSAVGLSGEMSQAERNRALQSLRDGRARVCVATDVAARGIDLPNLGLVIHAELPQNAETLQHRSGRTGRAGKKGISALLVLLSRRRRAEGLLNAAGVTATWSGAPAADEILQLDQERLLKHPLLTEEPDEADLAMATALLAERPPEAIAAALVKMYRAHLPAAEEVFDPGSGPAPMGERPERAPRGERPPQLEGGGVWFRLNVGRQKNADPRWLIPLICRQGKITKAEIGAIRIFERDTRFEIEAAAADRFRAALAHADRTDVRIELADNQGAGGPPPPRESHGPRKARPEGARPEGKKPGGFIKTPWKAKDGAKKKPTPR